MDVQAVGRDSPCHKREQEPRKDARRRCDQSPFFLFVRLILTPRTKARTLAHTARHPCLPENLHGFPHKCWFGIHLQRSVSRWVLSQGDGRVHVLPRVARTIAVKSAPDVQHHNRCITYLIVHGRCSSCSSSKQKSHSCTHRWSD